MALKPIRPMRGESALETLLSFMSDPEAVKKRVAQLKAETKKLNDLIAVHGKVEDINKLHEKATAAAQKAEAECARRIDASRDRADSEFGNAKKRHEELAGREDKLDAQMEEFDKKLASATVDLSSREKSISKAESDIEKREEALVKLTADAKLIRDEFEAKARRLRAAMTGEPEQDPADAVQ